VPLSASRLVFTLAGLVLMVLGVMEIIIRARGRQYLDAGDDPNIIDAL
jgi:DNA-binding protein